jgi:hypothetical protein
VVIFLQKGDSIMKRTKLFAILLAAAMLLTLCACGNTDAPAQDNTADTTEPAPAPAPKTADQLFEEKLKAFMSESDTKLSSMRADHRTKSRRR